MWHATELSDVVGVQPNHPILVGPPPDFATLLRSMSYVNRRGQTLEDALTVAGNCHRHYETAPDFVNREINQGFFRKLIIDRDGTIERAELTEPFAQLLTPDWQKVTRDTENVLDTPGHLPAHEDTKRDTPSAQGRPGSALADVAAGGTTKNPDDDLVGDGSHRGPLVELRGFEPLTP